MSKRAEELLRGGKGGLIMVEGDAGLGKSRLLEEFKGPAVAAVRRAAPRPDLLIFSGKGDAGRSGQVSHCRRSHPLPHVISGLEARNAIRQNGLKEE